MTNLEGMGADAWSHMHQSVSTRALYKQIYDALWSTLQEERECGAITQRLLVHYLGLTPIDKIVDTSVVLTVEQARTLTTAVARLKDHEPIQYVFGEAPFLGRIFKVNPDVLIPRPETEEMVQDIIRHTPRSDIHILDLGTGSGCIAISLQLALPQAKVWGLDIAPEALQIARENAQQLGAIVEWILADLLTDPLPDRRWHLMVSNPPYIRPSEQLQMHSRVLKHEPHHALFVPEEHPLLFHKKIVNLGLKHLYPGGGLYVEINEDLGKDVADLLRQAGFQKVHIQKDMHGKDRWVRGILA